MCVNVSMYEATEALRKRIWVDMTEEQEFKNIQTY